MKHLTRKLLLICLMLWLPLQGYAAATMPFCQHNAPKSQGPQSNQHAQHQMPQQAPEQAQGQAQNGQDPHAGHAQHHGKGSTACDNCTLCHMCSAMALPSFAAPVSVKPTHLFNIPSQVSFSPIFLEQPQRPPLVQSV